MSYSGILQNHLDLHQLVETTIDFICRLHLNHHRVIDRNSYSSLQMMTIIGVIFGSNDKDRIELNCPAIALLIVALGSLAALASIATGNVALHDVTSIILSLFGLMITVTFTTYNFCDLNSTFSNHEWFEDVGKCHSFVHHTRHFFFDLYLHNLAHRILSLMAVDRSV